MRSGILGVLFALAATACGDQIIDQPHRVTTFNEAGTVNLSLLPASNFRGGFGTGATASSLADAMKPGFNLSAADAVKQAVPTTTYVEEQLLDALVAKASIATPGATLPGASSTSASSKSASTTTNSASPSVVTVTPPAVTITTPNITINTNGTSGAAGSGAASGDGKDGTAKGGEKGGGAAKGGNQNADNTQPKATSNDKPKAALPIDPLYQYSVASSLYQHTRLIDAMIDAVAKADNYDVYLLPINVDLKPFARNQPYDAYLTVGFLVGSESDLTPVIAMPLLVTDNSEGVQTTQTTQILTQFEFALSAMISGFAGSADINKIRQQMRSIQATELNSLLTVGRATDNTLSIRIGSQRTGSGYGMVARNTTIHALLLVHRDSSLPRQGELLIRALSKVALRDAETGEELEFNDKVRLSAYEKLLQRVILNNRQCHDDLMGNNAVLLDKLKGAVQRQAYAEAHEDLPSSCAKTTAQQRFYETSLWLGLSEIAGQSEFQSASVRISSSVRANAYDPTSAQGGGTNQTPAKPHR